MYGTFLDFYKEFNQAVNAKRGMKLHEMRTERVKEERLIEKKS